MLHSKISDQKNLNHASEYQYFSRYQLFSFNSCFELDFSVSDFISGILHE